MLLAEGITPFDRDQLHHLMVCSPFTPVRGVGRRREGRGRRREEGPKGPPLPSTASSCITSWNVPLSCLDPFIPPSGKGSRRREGRKEGRKESENLLILQFVLLEVPALCVVNTALLAMLAIGR